MDSWAGLRSLWHGVKRGLTVLAAGILGALMGGITLGLLTFYVYGIGLYLGMPVGFLAGAIIGTRLAPKDVAITISLATAIGAGIGTYGTRTGQDPFWTTVGALSASALLAAILLPTLPRYVSARVRYGMAVPLAILFVGSVVGAWVWRIYSI